MLDLKFINKNGLPTDNPNLLKLRICGFGKEKPEAETSGFNVA